jgi:hypothetical protein
MGHGQVGLELNGPAKTGDRLGQPPGPAVSFTQVVVILSDAGSDSDRPADEVDRRNRMAGLAGYHAQQMQGVEASRLLSQ